MKVIEHLEKATGPLFSLEIVPPPRGRNIDDLLAIIEKIIPYKPAWIDVTAHPADAYYSEKDDGTIERKIFKKRPGTIGICGVIQNRFNIDTVAHLLCHGFTKEETEDALIELNYLGIKNILAIQGDIPHFKKAVTNGYGVNKHASDLVKQIVDAKKGIYQTNITGAKPLNFGIGVAGYPEKHYMAPNLKYDMDFLKQKIDAGADYITTQMFFDNKHYFSFVKNCRAAGINVPIVPGLKILKNVRQLKTIPQNFYIDFPDELVDLIKSNPENIEQIGIDWAVKQCRELLNFGVPVLHFYIINEGKALLKVLDHLRPGLELSIAV
ncbi:MAG: methylenetetrahydrofolate reductase [NAD(P)H] [Epsilonproteobacteria bacterium]|nr:MAG: methylenetetrahydrofolate reductase [NAD(P)H] [Campylobacterota bacterium]